MTISERIVILLVWVLTVPGLYFTLRAALRRRKTRRQDEEKDKEKD